MAKLTTALDKERANWSRFIDFELLSLAESFHSKEKGSFVCRQEATLVRQNIRYVTTRATHDDSLDQTALSVAFGADRFRFGK